MVRDILVALGMVVAPLATRRRDQVRQTMLQYESARSGRVVFKFVVGVITPTLPESEARNFRQALAKENEKHEDIVEVEAIDGPRIDSACSCGEKTVAWMQFALHTWPHAKFIGKTEDDTYVQLDMLMFELDRLVKLPMVMYGYMTIAVIPTRPTKFREKKPSNACAVEVHSCRKAEAQKSQYTSGCFLGDLEDKEGFPHGNNMLNVWWNGVSQHCGMAGGPRGGSTVAPFPTGPLAVFGSDLATALFTQCSYVRRTMDEARRWNMKTMCAKSDSRASLSLASTLCDTLLGHFLAMCDVNATIAHSTRTKSHHYMWRAAGLGWMPPSNLSLAVSDEPPVHFLKAEPSAPSGPNMTVGGEWAHTHHVVSSARGVTYPPLLFKLNAGYSFDPKGEYMEPMNVGVARWYTTTCAEKSPQAQHERVERAYSVMKMIRGQQPANMSDLLYLGGQAKAWSSSGCNPSRFSEYPRWPPGGLTHLDSLGMMMPTDSDAKIESWSGDQFSLPRELEGAVQRAIHSFADWAHTQAAKGQDPGVATFHSMLKSELQKLRVSMHLRLTKRVEVKRSVCSPRHLCHCSLIHALRFNSLSPCSQKSINAIIANASDILPASAIMTRAGWSQIPSKLIDEITTRLETATHRLPNFLAEKNERDGSYSLQWA